MALKNDLTPLDVPYPCFQGNNFQTAVGQLENLIQTFPKFLFFMFTIRQQESQILQIHTIKYSYCGAFYYGERHFVCKIKVQGQWLHYNDMNPQISLQPTYDPDAFQRTICVFARIEE